MRELFGRLFGKADAALEERSKKFAEEQKTEAYKEADTLVPEGERTGTAQLATLEEEDEWSGAFEDAPKEGGSFSAKVENERTDLR